MWSERRADAVRRELGALPSAGMAIDELQLAAAHVLGRVVTYDATCWAPVDPASNMMTGSVTIDFEPSLDLEQRFAEIEATGTDLNGFASLVSGPTAVARLSDAGDAALAASPRLAEIYRPLGFGHELRAAFAVDGACWGVAGLLRAPGANDFSDDEVAFLASVTPTIARALRAASLTQQVTDRVHLAGAVLVVDDADAIVAATPQAEERLAALAPGRRAGLGLGVQSVVAAVRTQGVDQARAHLRDATGSWVTITGSPLRTATGDTQIAVSIESTAGADLTDVLLAAHGLSAREQDVCRRVLAGESTAEIAASLYISANTVQDHLKSIFAKTGHRSRRELVAQLSR